MNLKNQTSHLEGPNGFLGQNVIAGGQNHFRFYILGVVFRSFGVIFHTKTCFDFSFPSLCNKLSNAERPTFLEKKCLSAPEIVHFLVQEHPFGTG